MRRTYKSKKEIGGGLDPRDVIHTLDSKSSIFDAFYIQNIKQTKREMTMNSNQSVASNKVRKRKYVKRIKEQEPIIQESYNSEYLTPDKSIRVNKAPDLFDQLFNSSIEKDSKEPVISFNKSTEKKSRFKGNSKPRSYQRRKSLVKKMNYSGSDGTDSDDCSSGDDKTKNMSSILRHELQIEKENIEPKPIDSSIDNLVNNLSLFNNNHQATITKDSTFKNLTNSNSPLCSTPFLSKYRGKSIYNFSPISINLNDSGEEAATISDGSIHGNEGAKDTSVITKDLEIDKKQSFHSNSSNNSIQNQVTSPILENKVNNSSKNSKDLPIEILESTEVEPFLGFSNDAQTSEVETILNTYKDINEFSLRDQTNPESNINSSGLNNTGKEDKFLGFSKVSQDIQTEAILNKYKDIDFSSNNDTNNEFNLIDSVFNEFEKEEKVTQNDAPSRHNTSVDNDTANSESTDDESLYDTCNSEDFDENTNQTFEKELVVVVEKLSDSIFERFYDKIPDVFRENNISENCTGDDTNFSISENESDTGSLYDENDQVYKTGNETDSINEINETDSESDNIDDVNETNCDTDNIDEISETESDSSDNNEPKEENCVSFVTTRKRNCLSNNSFMFMLENSITSGSSADFEKTVLSTDGTSQPNDMTITEIGVEENTTDNISRDDNNQTLVESTDNVNIELDCESIRKSARKSSLRPKRDSERRTSTIDGFNKTKSYNNINSRESTDSAIKCDNSIKETDNLDISNRLSTCDGRQAIVLQPGKRWERSLSIYRRMTTMADNFDQSILDDEPLDGKGRKYRQSVIATMEMQDFKGSLHNESIQSLRSTLLSKPHRSTIKIIRESNSSRASLCSTTILEDLQGYLTEDCDDTIIELSKLSIADSEHEVTILENFHETSNRIATARDYVLRRCNQADVILFDECYPDTVLKNCRKIGEGVYGEVFLWRAGDGRARVLKIVPIAGDIKVNGEEQKDYHEIISEIVIAMELSALRAPIPEIEKHLDEGKGVETLDLHSVVNATDVFNEVLAAHCVIGSYPSRLLDLWELYDETKGSENDNPAVLPTDQQFLVLELANAGQDLESFQFNNAEQAYALFQQIAFGLAVGEEAFQFEHRDLHWGNVLIAPTDQKYATFVLRGRSYRVARRGVSATIIDYSLSRVSLPLGGDAAALYNDLSSDDALFDAVGDYQFQVYRLMRDKLGNDWKNFEPYTNILWLHYIVDKMITALRYTRTNTKIHKHYIAKLKEIKNRILEYGSAVQYVLTDNEL